MLQVCHHGKMLMAINPKASGEIRGDESQEVAVIPISLIVLKPIYTVNVLVVYHYYLDFKHVATTSFIRIGI